MQTVSTRAGRKVRANRIKLARHRAYMTKAELSQKIGVNAATYARIEEGDSDPRVSVLEKIAIATEQNLMWLLTGSPETEQE